MIANLHYTAISALMARLCARVTIDKDSQ